MMDYKFITSVQDAEIEEIVRLYREAGWWDDDDDRNSALVLKIISGSYCFLTARDGDRIVGMARAISDGVSDAYIQDVTTWAGLRHKGVGSGLVLKIVDRLRKDGIRWIGLIAADNSHPFYEKLGFVAMPMAQPMLMQDRKSR